MKSINDRQPSNELRHAVISCFNNKRIDGCMNEKERKMIEVYILLIRGIFDKKQRIFYEAFEQLWLHHHLPLFNPNHIERIYTYWKYRPEIISDILVLANSSNTYIGSQLFWNSFLANYMGFSGIKNKPFILQTIAFFLADESIEDLTYLQLKTFYTLVKCPIFLHKQANKFKLSFKKTQIERKYKEVKRWFILIGKEYRTNPANISEWNYERLLRCLFDIKWKRADSLEEENFHKWLESHYSPMLILTFCLKREHHNFYEILQAAWRNNPKNLRQKEFYLTYEEFRYCKWNHLLKDLLGEYKIPYPFIDCIYFINTKTMHWLDHCLQGKSLRKAPGLPFVMGAKTEHYLDEIARMYPVENSDHLIKCFFLAELRARGADIPAIREIYRSRIMNHLTAIPKNKNSFSTGVSENPIEKILEMVTKIIRLDVPCGCIHQVLDFVYYVEHEKGELLPWKGMTRNSLVRRSMTWHLHLGNTNNKLSNNFYLLKTKLPKHAVNPFEIIIEKKEYRIIQLRTYIEFQQESHSLKHCVSSYFRSCINGQSSIFSLQEKDENGFHSKVTIELRGGIIVQAKGKFNRSVSKLESTIIRMWREENKEYISENLAA